MISNKWNYLTILYIQTQIDQQVSNTSDEEESGLADENTYKCTYGYRFFLVSCIDIDECTERLHNCNSGEICFNYDGGYRCDQVLYIYYVNKVLLIHDVKISCV